MALFARSNKLYDLKSEKPIRLRGVCLQDPLWARLAPGPRLLEFGPHILEEAKAWGVNSLRIPFHPVTIRLAGRGNWHHGLENIRRELDWILFTAQKLNLLIVIDFHSIGFPGKLPDEQTPHYFDFDEEPFTNLYQTNQEEIESFWKLIARQYQHHPNVAAFEIFNEASNNSAFGSERDWLSHAEWADHLIKTVIRPIAPDTLLIVSGLHFGYDLEYALKRPIDDPNIAYASHPYPHHSQTKAWDRAFGLFNEKYPVILSELGFSSEGLFDHDHHRGFRDWELEIRSYADQRDLSFFAWNFSHSWEPALLKNKTPPYQPNQAGEFFRNWLLDLAAKEKV